MELSTQFLYWHRIRLGSNQISLAEEYGVSRQAISKAVKKYEYKILVRLLALAQSIGALVEYHDQQRGLLIGQVVQLQHQIAILMVDTQDMIRVYYQSALENGDLRSFLSALKETINLDISSERPVETVEQLIALLTEVKV